MKKLATRRNTISMTLMWCSFFGSQHAQAAEPVLFTDAALVKIERERTRDFIEQVTGDREGSMDNSNTLGQSLTPELQAMEIKQYKAARSQSDKARASNISTALNAQLPELNKPSLQRWARRPAPLQQKSDNKTPVFTPDFSRQRLTMAGLFGKNMVDLPNQEITLSSNAVTPAAPSVFAPEDVVGLAELVRLGLGYSPVMEQVNAQMDSALSRTHQSRADLLPRASVRYATGPEHSSTTAGMNAHKTSSTTLRLTQPVINIPLIQYWMSDLSAHQASEWRLQAARESVALAVANATIALASARLVLDFSDEQLREFNELLAYVQARTQAGVASQADLERTRTRVFMARQVRIEQQAAYRNALLEMQRLTGQKPVALQLPYLNLLPGLPATQVELRRLVRDHSYDLQALRADIEAQQHTVSSQYGKALPVFGISLERDDGVNSRGTNPRQVDNRLLAVLTWDISLGGKEFFSGSGANSELVNRQSKLTEETDRALQSADADFALLQSASLRVTAGDAEQKAALAVVAAVREQLRTGRISSLLEALDAFDRHFAARQRLVQTLAQQMQAQAQLLRRIGLLSSLQNTAGVVFAPEMTTDISVSK